MLATTRNVDLLAEHLALPVDLPGSVRSYRIAAPENGLAVVAARLARLLADWCSGRDSNPHAFRHNALNVACLPIPPPEHSVLLLPIEDREEWSGSLERATRLELVTSSLGSSRSTN